jgi:hypothetical protein
VFHGITGRDGKKVTRFTKTKVEEQKKLIPQRQMVTPWLSKKKTLPFPPTNCQHTDEPKPNPVAS